MNSPHMSPISEIKGAVAIRKNAGTLSQTQFKGHLTLKNPIMGSKGYIPLRVPRAEPLAFLVSYCDSPTSKSLIMVSLHLAIWPGAMFFRL